MVILKKRRVRGEGVGRVIVVRTFLEDRNCRLFLIRLPRARLRARESGTTMRFLASATLSPGRARERERKRSSDKGTVFCRAPGIYIYIYILARMFKEPVNCAYAKLPLISAADANLSLAEIAPPKSARANGVFREAEFSFTFHESVATADFPPRGSRSRGSSRNHNAGIIERLAPLLSST